MLKPLRDEEIKIILNRALENKDNGLGNYKIKIKDKIISMLANYSNGDARVALNVLELAVVSTTPDTKGNIRISDKVLENCIQKKTAIFDKKGESHYDTISAFIKSMRGSDPQATVYYLAKMLDSGEDPMFVARRIMICASEDVGMANSNALRTAVACANAVNMIGMPEARILLSHAALEVAMSPKSNSAYAAIDSAIDFINKNSGYPIPMHLRNAPIKDMQDLGYSIGYKYPHGSKNNFIKQEYLPKEISNKTFYEPYDVGNEKKLAEYNKKLWGNRGEEDEK